MTRVVSMQIDYEKMSEASSASPKKALRPPRGLCEAHLLQAYKPCVIGAIPTKNYLVGIAPMTLGL